MHKAYVVRLTDDERHRLERVVTAGQAAARTLTHAYILLKADAGAAGPGWRDEQITAAFGVSASTVVRVRRRYATHGLEAALHRQRPRRVYRGGAWMESRRPIWSRWRAAPRRSGAGVGRCGCWRSGRSSLSWWRWSRTRRCAAL